MIHRPIRDINQRDIQYAKQADWLSFIENMVKVMIAYDLKPF